MIPIRIESIGGLGNRMFQYMFSRRLQTLVPGSEVVNAALPEFGIATDDHELPEHSLVLSFSHHVDLLEIARLLRSGAYSGVAMKAYSQRLEYYPDRSEMADLFPVSSIEGFRPIDPDSLVINVRGSEVLGDVHQDYGPVPVDFFSQVAEQSGLTPVIVGQLGDNAYSDEIRRRFDGCEIRESESPISDFELLRSARNVAIGVSTFSWLAVWLSTNVRQIFMPVSGIFHPVQRPDIDLLPIEDPRYRMFEFPQERWRATPEQLENLVARGQAFAELSATELGQLRRDANVSLTDMEQGASAAEITMLRRQKSKLRRELARVSAANAALEDAGDSAEVPEDAEEESGVGEIARSD